MRHLKSKYFLGIGLLAGGAILSAQNLDTVLPDPVPKQVTPVEQDPPEAPLSLEEVRAAFAEQGEGLAAVEGEEVLLSTLRGVRVAGDAADLAAAPDPAEAPVHVSGFPPLGAETAELLFSPFLDRPVSVESVERMQQTLRLYLAQVGRPFSLVYTPPQDITDGVIDFVVRESVIGQLRVDGNQAFSDRSYLSRIALEPGSPLDAVAISSGLDRINFNPFRDAAAEFAAGSAPGTTDVVLRANDRAPWRLHGGVNNTGSTSTTEERVTVGVDWGNVFGSGHLATLQWTSDVDAKYSRAISGNYIADLPGGNSFTLFGAYSEIESKTAPEFDQAGESWQAGVNYDLTLSATRRVQFGFDFKSSDNNLDFIQPPFVIPVVDNRTHIVQARAQYRGTLQDVLGSTSFGIKLTASPGGLTSENDDESFEAARAGAEAAYVYGNADLFRDTRLPRGWNWTVQAELQQSDGNLLGSEQMSGGGIYSVRGYEEGEVIADNGVLIRQELQLPPLRPLQGGGINDMLRAYLFLDYARLWNEDQLEGEGTTELFSLGAGFSYQLSRHLTAQFAYGWQLEESGVSSSGDDQRAHFNLNLSF
jgi:hemolysin activation/secretion protein